MTAIPVSNIIFYVAAFFVVLSALSVVVARSPVYSVLSLIFCFVSTAVLWLLLQAEFLSLVLVFVYVGAVMTLFLFVVMMLNLSNIQSSARRMRYWFFGILCLLVWLSIMWFAMKTKVVNPVNIGLPVFPVNYHNTAEIGMILYTDYIFPFELAAVILLVAIIASITLVFQGKRPGTKSQVVSKQLSASKQSRLRIIKMKANKNGIS